MVNWYSLQQVIGVTFQDQSLLQQAFVHSSYTNENPDFPLCDNERLEFLGDALLSFIVAEKLYSEFPHLPEGDLTEIRISLIRQETLTQLAASLNLGDYLFLGKGEESTGGREREANLANVLEALIGAIYLDRGLVEVRNFILSKFANQLEQITIEGIQPNYKALLQELTQAKYKQLPNYDLKEASGPSHDRTFTVTVILGDEILGEGYGKSKRSAEIKAARAAWEKLMATDL